MRTPAPRAALLALGAALLAGAAAAEEGQGPAGPLPPPAPPLLVRAGTVLTAEGPPVREGAVLCRDGKIAAVGKASEIDPGDAEVLDLGPHAVLLPGLVAASSGLAGPGAGVPESVAPDVRALDSFDWFRPQRRALEGGVTTVYLDAPRRRVLGGQGAVVKTAGDSPGSRTLLARAGLHGAVGDPARNPPGLFDAPSSPDPVAHPLLPLRPQSPGSRMAGVAMLREALAAGKAPGADPALAAVAEGREPLRLLAVEAADIEAALGLAKEAGVRLVLAGARDAGLAADGIAAAGVPVVLESPFVPGRVDDPWDPEEAGRRAAAMGNPAILEKRGVSFAVAAQDGALGDLMLVAASHVRYGLSPERAIRAVTLDAARILGVDARVGSLAPGKDADLAVFSGDPFDVRSTAVLAVVDGRVVFRREPSAGVLVLRAAAVHTGTGEVFAPGAVVVEGGKVVEVGPVVGVPPGARVIDRPDDVVVPGFVDGHSRLGLRAGGGAGPSGNLVPSTPAARALVPDDPSFDAALAAGITTALVSPGGPGPVVGVPSVVRTAGGTASERVLRESAGVEVSLAGAPDLPAALQGLRDAVEGAKKYHESWEKYEKEIKEYENKRKEYEEYRKKKEKEEEEKKKEEAKKDGEKKEEPPGDKKKADGEKEGEKKEGERKDSGKKDAEKKEESPGDKKKADGEKEGEKKEGEKKDSGKKDAEKKEEPPGDRKKADGEKGGEKKDSPVEPKEPAKPGSNPALDPWRDVFRKKSPVLCRASSAAEVRGALKVLREEAKLALVVVQGDEAWRVAAELKKADVGVLLGPRVVFTVDGRTVNAARSLAAAGVPFSFASGAGSGARDLPLLAGWAVRHGLGPSAAVRALTLDGARLLGVADRVGSLEPGKDADLVVLSGDPFGAGTRVRAVYVGGKAVFHGE